MPCRWKAFPVLQCGLNEIKTAGVTVKVVESARALAGSVAVSRVDPMEALVASPRLPAALLTLAMEGVRELQVTASVRSCVVLSLYVPVAVNCCAVPSASAGVVGVTASEVRTAGVIVNVVEPATPLPGSVADKVVTPVDRLVARPALPGALLTEATAELVELQVTASVRSCVVLSL